jgi:trimethylamine--corrinoid protein Co-methyltransferase
VTAPADLWPEAALEALHRAALVLLARAGLRVESAVARELLLEAGCPDDGGRRVRVPPAIVDEALASCPPSFTLAARGQDRSIPFAPAPGATYVHNMGGARDVVDPSTGAGRRATCRDQAELGRVMHHLVNQDVLTPLVQPGDVPGELEPLYSYLILAVETDKALGGPGVSCAFQAEYLTEMATAVTGATGEGGVYPVDLAYSPVSPLTFGREVTDALVAQTRRGRAIVEILPCPALATTAPGSVSAAVAQQHAEMLAGVVLTQLVRPGTPVYCGPRLSAVDPRTGVVVSGTPETGVASIAATLLARRCGLACDCYGPTSDSGAIDVQFGLEAGLNALLGLAAAPRLLSGIGDISAGVASCPEALVVGDEVLTYARYALTPRPWDQDAVDVDAMVDGVLSDHGFLGTTHTRRHLRRELCAPLVASRRRSGGADASGRAGLFEAARERATELVAREPVALPEDVLAELCRCTMRAAREHGVRDAPDPRRLVER